MPKPANAACRAAAIQMEPPYIGMMGWYQQPGARAVAIAEGDAAVRQDLAATFIKPGDPSPALHEACYS
jgi:hypothetical protein